MGTPKGITAQALLGFTGGAHCVRLLGAELKLLTGERWRLRVVGNSGGGQGATRLKVIKGY